MMSRLIFSLATLAVLAPQALAQPKFQPPVASPEVAPDRKVTLRVRAASADAVQLNAGDMPGVGRGTSLTKGDDGVWQLTVGPLPAGAYRYQLNIDGVNVPDPANPATSESNSTVWSLVVVPGSERFDARDVPHGAVAQVTYHSKSLKRPRRMHVYTPPGYESGQGKFPVLYLLHGASDSDASWSTVGRAGFILDNLIAAKRAKPMIVVMPNGHTERFSFGKPGGLDRQVDAFAEDFVNDVKPYVETHYRVHTDRANRAIAGLSMGGAQTLNIAFGNLGDYAHVGVFSSGVFSFKGKGPAPAGGAWAERHKKTLADAELRKGLRHIWFSIGKEDFLLDTSRNTVSMLREHGFTVDEHVTAGGHTWLNWRDYLAEFAGMVFE